MTMMDEPFVPEDGTQTAGVTDNFTDFMTKGGKPPAVVEQVSSLLADPFDAEDGRAPATQKNWLNSFLDDPLKAEGEQEEEPEPQGDEDPELTKFLAAGGTVKDYYFQQFQNQPKEEPVKVEVTAPDTFQAELDAVTAAREDLVDKMASNYDALLHAQAHGDGESYRTLLRERSLMEMEAGKLASRESFVNEKRGQAMQQTLSKQYEDTFVSFLRENHGITDDKMLDKTRSRVLETPYIKMLIENPQTSGLMAIPLVQEIMTKAALYDAQYGRKTPARRAPADPAATQTGSPKAPAKPAPAAPQPYDSDASFNDFMTKGRPKK